MNHSLAPDVDRIRLEFEGFLRIAQDPTMRSRLSKDLLLVLQSGLPAAVCMPRLYFEVRETDGTILEMWDIEVNDSLVRRLLHFLQRFSAEDARLMERMLRA